MPVMQETAIRAACAHDHDATARDHALRLGASGRRCEVMLPVHAQRVYFERYCNGPSRCDSGPSLISISASRTCASICGVKEPVLGHGHRRPRHR
jgi:hypothetical protein